MGSKIWIYTLLAILLLGVTQAQQEITQAQQETSQKYPSKQYVLQLGNSNLQDAIDEFGLILVKFYAPWCGHCKHLAPVYTELARNLALSEEAYEIQIAEVDCTENAAACTKHGIRGYPTLKYFIDGEVHHYQGPRKHDDMLQWLTTKPIQARNQKESEQM